MELVEEFVIKADLDRPMLAGAVPAGTRIVAPVVGGTVTGQRVNGTVVGPGADWAIMSADGFNRIDVRFQIKTDDGVVIYMHYTGLLEYNDKAQAGFAGGETSYDDHYFRSTPLLECGHKNYAWVNQTLFAAKGRILPGAVEYTVYRIT